MWSPWQHYSTWWFSAPHNSLIGSIYHTHTHTYTHSLSHTHIHTHTRMYKMICTHTGYWAIGEWEIKFLLWKLKFNIIPYNNESQKIHCHASNSRWCFKLFPFNMYIYIFFRNIAKINITVMLIVSSRSLHHKEDVSTETTGKRG